jgi:hypothetical protein
MSDSKRQKNDSGSILKRDEISTAKSDLSDIAALLKQSSNNMRPVALSYIAEFLPYPQILQDNKIEPLRTKSFYLISHALRNSSERDVRDLLKEIGQIARQSDNDVERRTLTLLQEEAESALQAFQRWGCQIARYRTPDEMRLVAGRYTLSREIKLQEEMDYGEQSFKDAEEALRLCTNPTIQPSESISFLNKKTEGGTQKNRFLVAFEYLINCHFLNSQKRGADSKTSKQMKEVRTRAICDTPVSGYAWGEKLVNEMYHLAKLNEVKDLDPLSKHLPFWDGYALTYEGELMSFLVKTPIFGEKVGPSWCHGQVPLEKFWPRLEELHDQVMSFPLDKNIPPNNSLEALQAFYDKVVEMIWLLGNITPVHKGTGKLVEQWLAMAHIQHHLRTPLIDHKNPQIDVLDITLPLSLYKERFFEFFELTSLPRPIAEMMTKRCSASSKTEKADIKSFPVVAAIAASGGSPVVSSNTSAASTSEQAPVDTPAKNAPGRARSSSKD